MKAQFDQNGLEQGYARITLHMEDGDQPFAQGDSIALGRPIGDNEWEFVSSNAGGNWTGSPQPLKIPQMPEQDGDRITFLLQPAYVDMLEDGPHKLALLDSSGKEKDSVQLGIYDVIWSGIENSGVLEDFQKKQRKKDEEKAAEKAAREQAEREAAAKAAAEKKAAEEKAAQEKAAREQAEREAAEKIAAQTSDSQQPAQTPPSGGKSKAGLIATIIIALLCLAGGGGYYWYSQKQAQDAAEQAEAAAKVEAKRKAAEEAARAEAERRAAEEAARKARADAKGRVGAFFAGQRSVPAAMKLADELDKDTPEQQDAVFRLYYYGARENDPQASLKYAECLDPSKPAWGTVKKDAIEAWHNYGKSPEGEKARQELKAWVKAQAKAGDSQARTWLGSME